MSDIWSRAWCETQQIPNFALKGITPSNEVRDTPNYIPRVNSNPTQYGSIYDNSSSPSPEPKEMLCFQFRKKDNKKPKTPIVLRKPRNVLEKVPNFQAAESHPPSSTLSTQTPPASPGQVRVLRRPSHTSSTVSTGYQHSDNTSLSTNTSVPGTDKLPDVVANYPIARNKQIDTKTVAETIQQTPVPIRNCSHTNIPNDNINNRIAEREKITNLKELEAENQRLKDIIKINSITLPNKSKFITKSKNTTENIQNDQDTRTAQELEQISNQNQTSRNLSKLKKTLNCMTSEEHINKSQIDRKNVETGTRKVTVYRSEAKTAENEKDNDYCPMPHRSINVVQGSAPRTPALNSMRMNKNNSKGSSSNIKSSTNPGSIKHIHQTLVETTINKSSKMKPSPHSTHTGYVFLGSGGQVLAECKGHSSQVIVKNVRSSLVLPDVDNNGSDEEFEVEKILASQKLREISTRMEKNEMKNSYTEMSIYPCTSQGPRAYFV